MTKIKPTSDLERLQWVDDAKFFTYNDANA
jgi:hypothetical protein